MKHSAGNEKNWREMKTIWREIKKMVGNEEKNEWPLNPYISFQNTTCITPFRPGQCRHGLDEKDLHKKTCR
jgi:hypothetical protein